MALNDYEQYAAKDWDGYGADPVTPNTLAVGRALCDLFAKPPETAPGADGMVCFEWCDFEKGHKVFLDVSADAIQLYIRVGPDRVFTLNSVSR